MYVFYTPFGTRYKGRAIYLRYALQKGLTKDQVREIFEQLMEKTPNLLAMRYDPKTGIAVIFIAKTSLIVWWAIAIPVAIIGGVIAGYFLGHGETDYTSGIVPGFNISFWDIIKFGALAFIIAGIIKIGVDAYVSVKKKEYMPVTPYEVFVKPIVVPVEKAYTTAKEIYTMVRGE